jgi:hypothetical protein
MHLPSSLDILVPINEEPGLVLRRFFAGQLHRSVRLAIAPSHVKIARSGVVVTRSGAFSNDQQTRIDVHNLDRRTVDWVDQTIVVCFDNRRIDTINCGREDGRCCVL